MPDEELLRRLSGLLKESRRVEADLVAHIAEVDARRLFARESAPSMFAYCTQRLHLSEAEAYLRIAAARASRRYPQLLDMLADGRLHLSGIERLAPHLTKETCETLLGQAAHKSRREIEELVAELAPRPPAAPTVRKLPGRPVGGTADPAASELRPDGVPLEKPGVAEPVGSASLSSSRSAVEPEGLDELRPRENQLRPDGVPGLGGVRKERQVSVETIGAARFRIRFDASGEFRDKLERLQALMRTSVPDGDLARVIELAVTEKLEKLESRRFGMSKAPRSTLGEADTTPRSRYIPAAVRRAVYKRDGGQCTYRDERGRRCTSRDNLEFHHREPFARGGEHSPKVLALMCRTHNALMAESDYGKDWMARFRRGAPSRTAEAVAPDVAHMSARRQQPLS